MSIVYHRYESNDDFVVDENVVAVEINDLIMMDDDRLNDLNMTGVVEVIVVENVSMKVVKVVVEDDDDETYDEMDGRDDVETQEVSIAKSLSLTNSVMMNEEISVDEKDCMRMVLLNHLDYVDCKMTNAMKLVVENSMVVADLLDHLLDHRHRPISTMKHSNLVHRLLDPLAVCLSNKLCNDE